MSKAIAAIFLSLMFTLTVHSQELPDKPKPAYEGQIIVPGGGMPTEWPSNLVMAPGKDDGRPAWILKRIGTCFECGRPMKFKEAAFDKKSSSLWILRTAMAVTDIELTHHSPCFQDGRCREANPFLGQTRAQGYGVAAGVVALTWMTTAWLRKGNRKEHIGGVKWWWVIPVVDAGASSVGIIHSLANWH